jgi:primary-amine oxidase
MTIAAKVRTRHPLDPLEPEEIRAAVEVVKSDSRVTEAFRFVLVTLHEPAKEAVVAFDSSATPAREAFALMLDNASGAAFELVVSLDDRTVRTWTPIDGAQPSIMLDEFLECEEAIKRSPEFLAALKKRGVEDVDLVMVDPWSAGNYGSELEEDRGRRLSRALCWVRSEPRDNGYARPIEGVVAVIDLNRMEVLRIEDYGVVDLPPESSNWTGAYIRDVRKDLKPIDIAQPDGPSFTVNGYEVQWQKWSFRIGFTPREGLVLHTIAYDDDGRKRPIVYRASVAEMVVPYGDPREQHFRKNAFDLGEYGLGMLANPLTLGCDCLGEIRYFDAHMTDSRGELFSIQNAVCMHEEDHGMLWKHTDWRTDEVEVRRSRRLVISFIATVANYEYAFYWYLYLDGTIELEVRMTGMVNTTTHLPGEVNRHTTEIAPQLGAPVHTHFFCARLDMSVDGLNNTVYEVDTLGVPTGEENPHGNAFYPKATLLSTEREARRDTDGRSARFWRITNPHRKHRNGSEVGYRLIPGENCPPFAQDDAAFLKRAGFLKHHLWVTPYDPSQKYPTGNYPNQHPTGDGLPFWTEANRSIENTDLVVWYTFGANHVPRPEDWPVMPAHHIGFKMKPDCFFVRNPAMDVPPTKPAEHGCCDSTEA